MAELVTDFDRFWQAYPRKIAKGDARKAWQALAPDAALVDRIFDALVWQGLGLDEHPELRDMYFGNYRRVVLFTQTNNLEIVDAGRTAAEKLGLEFEHRHVGLESFAKSVPVSFLKHSDKQ